MTWPRPPGRHLACLCLLAALLLSGCGQSGAPAVEEKLAATATRLPPPPASPTPAAAAASPTTRVAAATVPPLPTATATTTSVTATPPQPTATTIPSARPPATQPPIAGVQEYPVPRGSRPHDVAPGNGDVVWYTAQATGELGRLDVRTGETRHIPLGEGAAPHGVIVGPDGAPWITDGGLNAIVRVDPVTEAVRVFPLPAERGRANLNTATFDRRGRLWFTGQNGVYGWLDPETGRMEVFDAPRGAGPYGIATTPGGMVYYASLAGNHIARIDGETGAATVLEPPTARQGARRVWSDSRGRVWVSEYLVGQVAVHDPADGSWREWRLPGERPLAYAVYVDEHDGVWLSDFGGNALVRFDPAREAFDTVPLPSPSGQVRQILGRPGEVWGAESGADKLIVVRLGAP